MKLFKANKNRGQAAVDNFPENHEKKKIAWRRKAAVVGGAVLILSLISVGLKRYYFQPKNEAPIEKEISIPFTKTKPKKELPKTPNPVNGKLVSKDRASVYPLAVVIENHPAARPQSGLVAADVVYEALTEGNISRFLAIFSSEEVKEVGPIRSARTFFVSWASEYKAYFTHAGGAPDALKLINSSPVYDLPHTNGYFRRINYNRTASEHTLYSSTSSLRKLAAKKKYPNSISVEKLSYKNDAKTEERGDITEISIPYFSSSYAVSWSYDKEKNYYLRSLAGVPHKDRTTGKQIHAKVIVVQIVSRTPIVPAPGAKPTFRFKEIGSGKAYVFQDGKKTEGVWKKKDRKSRTKFYTADGNEIKLNRGVMWVEIIPPNASIVAKSSQS